MHCEAAIFDLDGVITDTAAVHSAAWKETFDTYLRHREEKHGEPFRPFTHEKDYLPYVDGKPRYEGVRSFLESRGIQLPFGSPADGPELETICGIGNKKNQAFNEVLARDGAKVYPGTIAFIQALKKRGIKVGAASSSKNCAAILRAAGVEELFQVIVDGITSAQLELKGKPEPDIFTHAAKLLSAAPSRTLIVEDAVSGVQAGSRGNFGLVLGIARENNSEELLAQGADMAVRDLSEISLETVIEWFERGEDGWCIVYHGYDPAKERSRASLLAVGNGYFCSRGAMEEPEVGKPGYAATYFAGLYNRLVSKVAGRDLENEDLVNALDWLPLNFQLEGTSWLDLSHYKLVSLKRVLHLDCGLLEREMVVEDEQGRRTRVESQRIASMHNPHLAAHEYKITALNYSGRLRVRCGLAVNLENAGVERYKQLNQKHMQALNQGMENGLLFTLGQTVQSGVQTAQAARVQFSVGQRKIPATVDIRPGAVDLLCEYTLEGGQTLSVSKVAALCISREQGIKDALAAAKQLCTEDLSFESILATSKRAWREIWQRIDIQLEGDRLAQKLLRLHLYHLVLTFSRHTALLDAGIPARGWHGEAYRGHIFWDEIFIIPLLSSQFPEVAKAALLYRYRRLDAARRYAREHGYKGAMFPWQSGSDGREETQIFHLNPLDGTWGPDHSSLQRHVSLAVAYNVWMYSQISGDKVFLENEGAELIFEICRFWASACRFNPQTGRYSIERVMGPDEFHERHPYSHDGGLKDNAYTNIMTAWLMQRALSCWEEMDEEAKRRLKERIGFDEAELKEWRRIMRGLNLTVLDEGIIAQFDGYFELKELDWNYFRSKYGDTARMDRLLKAEGLSPDDYKVSKQADLLMAFYNLGPQQALDIIRSLGIEIAPDCLAKNLDHYLPRTSHGSTLSRVVHAVVAHLAGRTGLAWSMYREALISDFNDIQGGTTGEGIHSGVMAGTVWAALSAYAGLDLRGAIVSLSPCLPESWEALRFGFLFKGRYYRVQVTGTDIKVRLEAGEKNGVEIALDGRVYQLAKGAWLEVKLCHLHPEQGAQERGPQITDNLRR